MQFLESSSSFAKEIDKKELIPNFYRLVINLFSLRSHCRIHWGMDGAELPAV